MRFGSFLFFLIVIECDALSYVLVHPFRVSFFHSCIIHAETFTKEFNLLVDFSGRKSDLE